MNGCTTQERWPYPPRITSVLKTQDLLSLFYFVPHLGYRTSWSWDIQPPLTIKVKSIYSNSSGTPPLLHPGIQGWMVAQPLADRMTFSSWPAPWRGLRQTWLYRQVLREMWQLGKCDRANCHTIVFWMSNLFITIIAFFAVSFTFRCAGISLSHWKWVSTLGV